MKSSSVVLVLLAVSLAHAATPPHPNIYSATIANPPQIYQLGGMDDIFPIATVTIPKGTYLVHSTVQVWQTGGGDATCQFSQVINGLPLPLGYGELGSPAGEIVLEGIYTLSEKGSIYVECTTNDGATAAVMSLTAMPVTVTP